MWQVGRLQSKGKSFLKEATNKFTTIVAELCEDPSGKKPTPGSMHAAFCDKTNFRAVAFSLTPDAEKEGVKTMPADKWTGESCKLLEQCKTADVLPCSRDRALPHITATKGVRRTYHYRTNVKVEMGQVDWRICFF